MDVAWFGLEEDLARSRFARILRATLRNPGLTLSAAWCALRRKRLRASNRLSAAAGGDRLRLGASAAAPRLDAAARSGARDNDVVYWFAEGARPLDGWRERLAAAMAEHPDWRVAYGDALAAPAAPGQLTALLLGSFDEELFLRAAPAAPCMAIRAEAWERLGPPLTAELPGSAHVDWLLRASCEWGERSIGHIDHLICRWEAERTPPSADAVLAARLETARRHVARRSWRARCELDEVGFVRLTREPPTPTPRVSAIIPTRDRLDLLRPCVEGLLNKTDWPNLEILIVDNGSVEPETRAWFAQLEREGAARILSAPGPFNYSRLNNLAARAASGEILALLNNDISMLEPDWLSLMAPEAARAEIGAVGARLLYPSGLVQHAGVILALDGLAGHEHQYMPAEHRGYMHQAHVTRRVSAVTGACLVVSRDKFLAVGGLDEEKFAVALNDVDLCLRLDRAGWRSLYLAEAVLTHHESATRANDRVRSQRARWLAERQAFVERWPELTRRDPWRHPGLGRASVRAIPPDYGPAPPQT